MTAWLGVVSAEHVRRGVEQGIAQIGHGKREGLARMRAGDQLVYYSAQERLGERPILRQFTAIGSVSDDTIWQEDLGAFKPFRRRVDYDARAVPVALETVKATLDLTRAQHWGQGLRRGLVELTEHDIEIIRRHMLVDGK